MSAITTPPDDAIARLAAMDTPALRAELASALGLTARHLLYLAAVWAELERRGEDLSDLRTGIGAYLPLIAAGAVLPETVVRFAGQPTVLRSVSALPPEEQRRLAAGGGVPIVVRSGERYEERQLPAHALTASQARLVFGDRKVRSVAEQVAVLTAAAPKPAKAGAPPRRGKARADREKGVIRVGKVVVAVADVVAALADMRHPQDEAEPDETVVVKLTADEKRLLAVAAADGGTTQQQLVRNALRAAGLI